MKTVFGACSWYSRAEGCLSPADFVAQAQACGVERLTVIERQDAAGFPEWMKAVQGSGIKFDFGLLLPVRYADAAPAMACALVARDDVSLAQLYALLADSTPDGGVDLRGRKLLPSLWVLGLEIGLSENLNLGVPEHNRTWLDVALSTGATVRLAGDPTADARFRMGLIRDGLGEGVPGFLPYCVQAYFSSKDEFLRSVSALAAAPGGKTRVRSAPALTSGWEHHAADVFWQTADISGWLTSAAGIESESWLRPATRDLLFREDAQAILEQRCRQKLSQLFMGNGAYEKMLNRELALIEHMHLASYFLQVADLTDALRAGVQTVWVRGSAAASLVVHLLGVSQVDPVAAHLLPERFLNVARSGLPDIDLDVPASLLGRAREIALRVLPDACLLRVFNYWSPHDALQRSVEKYLSKDEKGSLLKRMTEIATRLGVRGPWPATWGEVEKLPGYEGFKDYVREMALARALTGFPRSSLLHPSGIGTGNLWKAARLPSHWMADFQGKPVRVPAYGAEDAEAAGILKYDLLANTTLDVINEMAPPGEVPDFSRSPFGLSMDEAVLRKALTLGLTTGLPQINEIVGRKLLGRHVPDTFEGLAQFNALIRLAGSNAGGVDRYLANSPVVGDLAPYLAPTRGVFIFQEQVMRVAYHLGGLDWSQSDDLRVALGEGPGGKLEAARRLFVAGCQKKTGRSPAEAQQIFESMSHGGHYLFNRAHAVAYAHLIAWCLFFKATQPEKFFMALLHRLQGVKGKFDRGSLIRQMVFDARLFGARFAAQEDPGLLAQSGLGASGDVRLGLDAITALSPVEKQPLVAAAAAGRDKLVAECAREGKAGALMRFSGLLGLDTLKASTAHNTFSPAQRQASVWGFAMDETLPGLPIKPGLYSPFKLGRHPVREGESFQLAGYLHPWVFIAGERGVELRISFLIGDEPLSLSVDAADEISLLPRLGDGPLSEPRLCQVKLTRENGVWGLRLQGNMECYTEPLTPASIWIVKLGAAASRAPSR
jgi:hypothetical protein